MTAALPDLIAALGPAHVLTGADMAAHTDDWTSHYTSRPKCLIPGFDGAILFREWRDALWVRFFTGAPPRQRQSVERYSIVKRA